MLNRESEWHRWEPHIHAPGTVMNDQFSGPTAWHDYLTALEQATPVIEAIAVTDYYVTDTYEEMLRRKAAGRLPSVKLIFPNVELRLDVATTKGGFVNLHLFVNPEDPQHTDELRRLLSRLQFNVMQDCFNCTRADLIRLGKKADRPYDYRRQCRTELRGEPGQGQLPAIARGVDREWMGEEAHPDRGGGRSD